MHIEVYGHRKRVCFESGLWERKKNPLPHRGIERASAAYRSDALPSELHLHSTLVCLFPLPGPLNLLFPLKVTCGRKSAPDFTYDRLDFDVIFMLDWALNDCLMHFHGPFYVTSCEHFPSTILYTTFAPLIKTKAAITTKQLSK